MRRELLVRSDALKYSSPITTKKVGKAIAEEPTTDRPAPLLFLSPKWSQ
jgi:hypothetical protein